MMVFVTGAGGQLGCDVVEALRRRGHTAIGSNVTSGSDILLDITDGTAVERCICQIAPDAVIHCAAWTAVDLAEDDPDAARAVNADGTRNVAKACRKADCKLIYISTDYVFGDQKQTPWKPEDKPARPLNVYGQTKLEGEQAVANTLEKYFVVRSSWIYGRNGGNFVKTMLKLGRQRDVVRVVNDQIGSPTYSYDLAQLLADMVQTDLYGYYHAVNEGGFLSWYEFACEIFRQAGVNVQVLPVTTEAYAAKAMRPRNSCLDTGKLRQAGFAPLPAWQDALARFLQEIGETEDGQDHS